MKFILWNENTTFVRDFYQFLWDIWDRELKKNLYLVVQYLEIKEGIVPTITTNITRKLVEDEYDLGGYGIIQLNDEYGKFLFGTFTVTLYDGPIYVEEWLENKKNGFTLKITVQQPGEIVHPMPAPKPTRDIPENIRKEMDLKKSKILKRQKKRDNIKKAEEDLQKRKEEARDNPRPASLAPSAKTPKSKDGKTPKKGGKTPEDSKTPDGGKTPKSPGKSKKTPKKLL